MAALRQHLEAGPGQGTSTGDPAAPVLQEELGLLRTQLSSQAASHQTALAALHTKLEAETVAHREALSQLQASSVLLSKDNEQLHARLAEAEKENADAIELWQAKLASAVTSHQQAMEELKASPGTGTGDSGELVKLLETLERLKLQHKGQLEESLAKHTAEAKRWTQDVDELRKQLHAVTEEKERLVESLRTNLESAEDQHLVELEEALGKLHNAEVRVKELEEDNSKLGHQVEEKALEVQEQNALIQTLRSHQSQGDQDVQSLLARVEEAEREARVQEGKVGYSFMSIALSRNLLGGFLYSSNSHFMLWLQGY